jgi:hypothetical protein
MKREISAARSRREKGKDAIVRIRREDKKILHHVKVIDDTQTFPHLSFSCQIRDPGKSGQGKKTTTRKQDAMP